MSNQTANDEEDKKVQPVRPELLKLPEWFQTEYKNRPLPPLTEVEVGVIIEESEAEIDPDEVIKKAKITHISVDPRRVGPAAQQGKKPL